MSNQKTTRTQRSKSENARKLLLASMTAATVVGVGAVVGDIDKTEAAELYYWNKYNALHHTGYNIQWTYMGGSSASDGYPGYYQDTEGKIYSIGEYENYDYYDRPIGKTLYGYTHGGNRIHRYDFVAYDQTNYYLGEVISSTTTSAGALVESGIIAPDGTYPVNGYSGGYWYIRGAKANVAPTTPIITIPSIQFEHGDQHIIGFNSTDANGDAITYTLEASYDGEKTWTQLYKGPNKTFTYTVPNDKTQVKFRVLASDGTANSAYATSAQKSIREVMYYWSKFNVLNKANTENPDTWAWRNPRTSHQDIVSYTGVKYHPKQALFENTGTLQVLKELPVGSSVYLIFSDSQLHRYTKQNDGTSIMHIITPGDIQIEDERGALIQNNLQGGFNAYQHGVKNPDNFWYERGQRVLSEDVTPPIIELSEQTDYNVTSTVTVKTHDLGTVTSVKWEKGNQPVSYFTSNGTAVAGGKFTVSENGEYTVYAVDNKGNAAVEVINVTKVNAKPVIVSAATSTPYVVLDNTSEFQVHGNAHDPDGQDMTVTATHLNATGSASVIDGRYELTLNGSDYAIGFYTDPIQIIANDGFVDSETYSFENPIVIRVDDASHYNNQLESHSTNLEQWTASQHEAFYVAYESIYTYEKERSVAALTDAQNKIDTLKTQTGVTESVTLTEWSDRMNLVTATVAIESAEASLQKADYENAQALVEGLSPSSDKDRLIERKEELNRFHTAQDALITMEGEPSIVTWDKINEAQSYINVVENNTNKSNLQKRLNNVIKKYMSNITTVTPEDLENFETENVDPKLGGMYDEYLDAFKPLGEGSNAQDLVDFVNALKLALQDLTQSQVDTLHANIPTYAQTSLKPVTDAVDALLEYRQTFLREEGKDNSLTALIQNVSFATTNDYMNTMTTAMQEVIEYNVTHDDNEKSEGVDAIVPLWDGQLKTDMQAYLDNGIPEIIVLEDPYEYINDGSFNVIGSIQDANDSTHNVVVTFDGIEKTVTSTDGSFSVTFEGVAEGVYVDDITIEVSDRYTTKSHTVTKKPVITVSNIELFKKFAKALSNDLGLPLAEINEETLISLKSLFDNTTSTTIDSSDRQIRDLENAAQALSGQEEGELETLVKSIFLNIRLEWLINNYQSANVEDFAWAGVEGVNLSNMADLKLIISDYVAQFTGNMETPGLEDYQEWLQFQSFIAEVRSTIETAEETLVLEELHELIKTAKEIMMTIPDWISAKSDLQNELTTIVEFYQALDSVIMAESTFEQADKDVAQILVEGLPAGVNKTGLQDRLDALQIVIDAIAAVELAESTLDESDQLVAQHKVDLIADDNPKKEELQNRLDAISAINNAILAVVQAESTYAQGDKDQAQTTVDALADSLKKEELLNRLLEVQKVIDAIAAVDEAERTIDVDNILSAQTKVSAIADSNPIKEELQNRLDALEFLRETIQSVAHAESTNNQTDKDAAQFQVDLLPDGENKTKLQNRLDELQLVIDAIQAIELAELTLDEADQAIAQGKVDLIADDNPNKAELQSRLDAISNINNAILAVENAESTYSQDDKDRAHNLVDDLADSTTKTDLVNRLVEVQIVIDAIEAVGEAERTVNETEILLAQSKIDAIADDNPKKSELQTRLDAIESLRGTILAVVEAETTYSQTDKDYAQSLVDALTNSESKVTLHDRLVEVQKVIDAMLAVDEAESTLSEEDLLSAKSLVAAIADSNPVKSELQDRLDLLEQLKAAMDAVDQAEQTLVLLDKEEAQQLVDALPASPEKDSLLERLDILQNLLEKMYAEEIATNEVEKAESTFSQSDKDSALEIVEALEDSPVKDELLDRLDDLQSILDSIVEIESAVSAAEESKTQEDIDTAQGMLDELADSDIKSALQDRLDAVNQYIEAEKAVSNAEENLYQRVKDAAQELVDALPDSSDKQALQDRLDVLQDILDGKATDLLDDLINNPETVTPEDLADYTDETVYEELMPDYIDEIGNIGESITKDQVIEVVRLINKLELAKRSMLAADILAYQQELEQTSLPTKSNYPEPALMSSIATYVQNDSELENIITLIAAELNRSADEIREEITALLEGNQKQFVGFYVVKYQTETAEEIESYSFENVEFGQIDVVANVPAGYELVGESDYSFELTEDNTGHEVIFTVKESAAEEGDYSVRYELEDGTLIFESNLTAIFGEVTVSAEVPEGYTLVGNPSYSFELTEDNSGYEVVFVVKEDVSSLGDYTVRYQLEDGTIINEHHETAEFGEVTVTADAPQGYTVIGDASSSFVLTEENSGYEIVFVIKEEATQAGEYTVNYLLEDGSVISESTLTAPYGELTVTAEVPVGFVLADGAANQQTVHFEEETPLEITFTVKVPETSVGNYVVQYVLDDLSVIEEKTFTAEYGDVNVVAVLPDGYELSETEDSHKTFELSEITEGTVLKFIIQPIGNKEVIEGEKEETFVPEIEEEVTEPETVEFENISEDVPMIEGANDGNETVIASTIGEETVFVRSLMQVASLDNLYLTTTPYVAELPEVVADGEAHGEYLFKTVQALAIVKAHINNPTEESKSEAIAYIASNIYDGAYKKQLLDLLEYDIKDIGDDGEPDLTPVFPTPPSPPTVDPNPTPPSVDPVPDVEEPPTVNPEPWIPPVPKPEKPSIEIPDIPGGETIAKDGNVDQTDIDGGYEWTITKPTESVYTLKANGIEITVPIEIEADVWEIKWVHTGEEHYNLTVIADGKAITTFKKPVKVSKTHDHAYLLRSIKRTYSAMPYTYQSNKFKFETKTTGEFYFSQTKVTFDDIENVYSKAAIEELASRHIVFGTTSETYSPNSKLTRAQFAAMLTRALALEATGENPFADTKGKWFEHDVQALYEVGIIKGTSATTFDPNSYITRQQAASMLEKILEHTESKVYIAKIGEVASMDNTVAYPNAIASTFEDSHQISDYAKNAVGLLQSLGVLSGKEGNVFDPKGHLTRAQMAKILTRTLNYTDKF